MYQQFYNPISNFFCSEFYLFFILTIFIPFDKCIKIYNVTYFIFLGLFIICKLLNSMNYVSFHISHEIQKNMHVYYFQDLIMIKKNHKIIQKEENWIENSINIIILLFL